MIARSFECRFLACALTRSWLWEGPPPARRSWIDMLAVLKALVRLQNTRASKTTQSVEEANGTDN